MYGDYQGDWVDEGSELRAAGGKGWARVVAEHEWLSLQDAFGLPVHIFRCGGIYGERWCLVGVNECCIERCCVLSLNAAGGFT